ncbi:MAG: hypothetical protein ABI216_04120 [Devosia sp.]
MKAFKYIVGIVIILGALVMVDAVVNSGRYHTAPAAVAEAAVPVAVATTARSHAFNKHTVQACVAAGNFAEAAARHRDEGATLADMHTVTETLEIPDQKTRPQYQELIDAVYANPQIDPQDAGERMRSTCLQGLVEK